MEVSKKSTLVKTYILHFSPRDALYTAVCAGEATDI